MLGVYLDPDKQDLALDATGNLRMARDGEAIGQHAKQRLKTFQGEWFLDTEAGVPWMKHVFPRPPSLAIAESIIKLEIIRTPGVTEMISFNMIYAPDLRGLEVLSTEIRTIYDDIVEPFAPSAASAASPPAPAPVPAITVDDDDEAGAFMVLIG